jgi:hypothetical protein
MRFGQLCTVQAAVACMHFAVMVSTLAMMHQHTSHARMDRCNHMQTECSQVS